MPFSITKNGWRNSCRLDVQQSKAGQEDSWCGGRDVLLPCARGAPPWHRGSERVTRTVVQKSVS